MVQVSVWAGMSEENKKKVVEGMTRVLEELGISPSQLGKTLNKWTVDPTHQRLLASARALLFVSFCFMVCCVSVSLHFRVGLEGSATVWTRNLARYYPLNWYFLR